MVIFSPARRRKKPSSPHEAHFAAAKSPLRRRLITRPFSVKNVVSWVVVQEEIKPDRLVKKVA
jgi:hypothetical protein